ncbi:MAG: rhomboid family intramembrane serine protease, partial [Myxococcota bacterium]
MHGRGHGGGGIGPPVTPPIVKTLLIANAVVFLAQKVFEGQLVQVGPYPVPMLEAFLSVWPALVWQGGYVWQPFTYMWLHASFFHIAMNMFMLWMFGSQLAMVWGAKRFLRFYLICGVGAGLIIATVPYLLFGIGLPTPLLFPTLGAS